MPHSAYIETAITGELVCVIAWAAALILSGTEQPLERFSRGIATLGSSLSNLNSETNPGSMTIIAAAVKGKAFISRSS
jgi:hypothetical protein